VPNFRLFDRFLPLPTQNGPESGANWPLKGSWSFAITRMIHLGEATVLELPNKPSTEKMRQES